MISRTSVVAFCTALFPLTAIAAPPTTALNAFNRYAAAVEDRLRADSSTANFLRVLPDESRRTRARNGQTLVENAQSLGVQPDIAIPDGQIQHRVGGAFLQGATIDGVLPRLRNYNNRSRYMMPEIIASRLTDHQGDVYQVYLRLVEKSILPGVFDLNLRVAYQRDGKDRLMIDSRSMSVEPVSDASAPVGSVGKDQGLLWALNHYWRFLQADGGVYVECEALVLSRPTPVMLGWIARPVIGRAARESLTNTIRATLRMLNSPDAAN